MADLRRMTASSYHALSVDRPAAWVSAIVGSDSPGDRQIRTSSRGAVSPGGFIVTTLTGTNRAVVHFCNQHGTAEEWIKEGKEATHWTRLSCHRFRANEVRLLLGVILDNLGNLLRRLALPWTIGSWSLTSLQQRLIEIGGCLIRHARYFTPQLVESYLT